MRVQQENAVSTAQRDFEVLTDELALSFCDHAVKEMIFRVFVGGVEAQKDILKCLKVVIKDKGYTEEISGLGYDVAPEDLVQIRNKYQHYDNKHFIPLIHAALSNRLGADQRFILLPVLNYLIDSRIENEEFVKHVKMIRVNLLSASIAELFEQMATECEVTLSSVEKDLGIIAEEHALQDDSFLKNEPIAMYGIDKIPNLHKVICKLRQRSTSPHLEDIDAALYGWSGQIFRQFIETSSIDDLELLFEKAPYAAYVPLSGNYQLAHFPIAFVEKDMDKLRCFFKKGALQLGYFSASGYDAIEYEDSGFGADNSKIVEYFFALSNPNIMQKLDNRGYLEEALYAVDEGHALEGFIKNVMAHKEEVTPKKRNRASSGGTWCIQPDSYSLADSNDTTVSFSEVRLNSEENERDSFIQVPTIDEEILSSTSHTPRVEENSAPENSWRCCCSSSSKSSKDYEISQ